MTIKSRLACLERAAAAVEPPEQTQEEEWESRKFLRVAGACLKALRQAEFPEHERAAWDRALSLMADCLRLVRAYVEAGRIGALVEDYCCGSTAALWAWAEQKEGEPPLPFPFQDGQCPPRWGVAAHALGRLRGRLETEKWSLGEAWYREICRTGGPAMSRPFSSRCDWFLDEPEPWPGAFAYVKRIDEQLRVL
jgi:hypothetical protein